MEFGDRQSQDSAWRLKANLDSHVAHSNPHSRPALPPIKMLDLEKIKREEADHQARGTHIVSNVSSPSIPYPSGPPPPYSHPSFSSARSPPESRRSSGDDVSNPANKQSLPSLHEALGVEQPTSYHSQTPYSSAAIQPVYHAVAPASPPAARRSFAMEPPPPPQAPISHGPRSPYPQAPSNLSPRQMPDQADRQRPVYAHQPPAPPQLHTAQSPLQHASQYPRYPAPVPSPSQERPPAHPVHVTQSRPLPYGYSTAPAPVYPASYAYPAAPPPPAAASSSIYQPSITQPAPVHPVEPRQQQFGESVKRHLDLWDFGEALNEIIDSSNYMLDFGRQYGARLHQTQRSDPVPSTLPQLQEIEHLMEKSRRQMDCYAKMREFVVAQQTAYFQQAQEQQYRAQDGIKRDSVHNADSAKIDAFAGTEAKKRRGRAAPPGRCHSCNRAETPEWRRGPDGARTLCNACGLHYAKLTRKAGKSAAAISSSNLRPKAPEEN